MEKQTENGFLESFSRIPIRKADSFRAESQEYFVLGAKPLTWSSVDLYVTVLAFKHFTVGVANMAAEFLKFYFSRIPIGKVDTFRAES